jgi:hypothetical protein
MTFSWSATPFSVLQTPTDFDASGTIDGAGNFHVPVGNIRFDGQNVAISNPGTRFDGMPMTVVPHALSDFVGTVDPQTGDAALTGSLELRLSSPEFPDCPVGPVSLNMNARSFGGQLYNANDGRARVAAVLTSIPPVADPTDGCDNEEAELNESLGLPLSPDDAIVVAIQLVMSPAVRAAAPPTSTTTTTTVPSSSPTTASPSTTGGSPSTNPPGSSSSTPGVIFFPGPTATTASAAVQTTPTTKRKPARAKPKPAPSPAAPDPNGAPAVASPTVTTTPTPDSPPVTRRERGVPASPSTSTPPASTTVAPVPSPAAPVSRRTGVRDASILITTLVLAGVALALLASELRLRRRIRQRRHYAGW